MNSIIRITKEFRFEMAHALSGHDGLCKHIHGHSYQLDVTVKGAVNNAPGPKQGMVLDFGQLKDIVQGEVIAVFDHSLVLKEGSINWPVNKENELFARVVWVPYQPSCENMLPDFVYRIMRKMPPHLKLFSLKLRETATSYAEWYAQDNNGIHK